MEVERVFKDSLQRISSRKIDDFSFLDFFYISFTRANDSVRKMFEEIDMVKQSQVLRKSISELVRFYSEKTISDHLIQIGKSHSRGHLNIHPDLYDEWLKHLLISVKKYDPEFSPQVELAWSIILAPGIAYMKYSYKHPDAI